MLKDVCYVVRPAKPSLGDWRWVYDELVQPTAQSTGLRCVLGTVMGETGTLIEDLIKNLIHAELVIVDISGCDDPKTFYQLGVRHARSNRTILITPNQDDVFSDFQPFYSLTYPNEAKAFPAFRRALKEMIDKIREQPEEPDNPVQRYLNGAARLVEENRDLHQKLDDLQRVARENQDLKEKMADLERTLTTLAAAPQSHRPEKRIVFTPLP
ncbi:MAG: hypothetical protein ABW208_20810 [Pyrinomonadaceae bacterium]